MAQSERSVLFSCPHPLNASGPSRPLTRIRNAIQQTFPFSHTYDPSAFPQLREVGRLGDALGPVFDDLVTDRVEADRLKPDLMLGGGGASLRLLNHLGPTNPQQDCVRGTLWFSSHWHHAQRILAEEYAKHGVQHTPIHPYVAWRAKKEQDASDFMIVPSERCKSTYPAALQGKIHVAEFGVDLERYTVAMKRKTTKLCVLFPATNPFRKGLNYALQAWKHLDPAKYQLTVTGAQLAPLPPNMPPVITTGWVSDDHMDGLYRTNDVLLLPSLEEGQALASLEAAASGMPLIVTPEVGLPITDGEEGFVVPSRDAASIQVALERLHDPATYEEMSRKARAFAEKRPWGVFSQRVTEVLEAQA